MDQKLREALASQDEYLKKNTGKLYQTSDAGPVRVDLVRALIETVERLQDEVAELKRSIAP
jgi:hypothetical protein